MNIYLYNFIKDKKPGAALDLGCGQGFDIASLKHLGWQCDGVDVNMGVDLNKPYSSKRKYDLVISNYVLQLLDNKEALIKSAFDNLKDNGYFFLHTFDESDKNSISKIDRDFLNELLVDNGFIPDIRIFDFYDNEHQHWHKILEAISKRKVGSSPPLNF